MALVLADRVQEYSTTTGTGTLTLSGAYAGFQTFAAAIGNGNTCYYTISSDSNQWEVGIGTVGVGTLARTTLISSSTGSKISFTGTLTVFVDYPAEKAVYLDASGNYVPSTPTFSSVTDSALTLNRVTYAGTGGLLRDSANLTFDGTTLTTANDASISGLTVGKGGGALVSNTALGLGNLQRNTTGSQNTSGGWNALTYNTTGVGNTVFGYFAGVFNTTANNLTAYGAGALANATTAVATFGSITAGSGYTNGTYTGVAMSAVSGATFVTYPTVTVVVSGGVVSSVTLVTAGVGATTTAATVLTVAAALIGGTGSGFSIPVATFATATTNTAVGYNALAATTTGSSNTGVGNQALTANTTGSYNSAFGYNALIANTTGFNNSAFGFTSLGANTTGSSNSAFGFQSLNGATTGTSNTAIGSQVMSQTTTGSSNVAIGYLALYGNTIGNSSTAIGTQALFVATTAVATLGSITGGTLYTDGTYTGVVMTRSSGSTAGTYPTATIVVSGGSVTTVTITSAGAQFKDTTTVLTAPAASIGGTGSGFSVPVATLSTASNNTAIGLNSMVALTTGSYNTGLGQQTLSNATTAQQNTALGFQAGSTITTGSNNLILGNTAAASTTTVSNEITLGNSSITAFRIPGLTITGGAKWMNFGSSTVALLPAAATAGLGAMAFVTDALAPTFGSTVAGGGAVASPVYSDGTNWKVG